MDSTDLYVYSAEVFVYRLLPVRAKRREGHVPLTGGAQAIRLPPEKHPARDVMSEFASFLLAVAQGPRELAPRNFTRSFV